MQKEKSHEPGGLPPGIIKEKALVDTICKLERFNGKGGWTYTSIPASISPQQKAFGWRRVRGFIDDYEIKQYHLMPMGNGKIFLPVKAAIRKQIGKKVGDRVRVILYPDDTPLEIPADLQVCLEDEPAAMKRFRSIPEVCQKEFVNWINSAKKDETRVGRIAITVEKLLKSETLNAKLPAL
jgi:hypothetical protein